MAAHTRRAFFGWLGVLTVGMVLDPERALWVPGRRTYFDFPRHRTVSEIFEEELVAYFMGVRRSAPLTYAIVFPQGGTDGQRSATHGG